MTVTVWEEREGTQVTADGGGCMCPESESSDPKLFHEVEFFTHRLCCLSSLVIWHLNVDYRLKLWLAFR